MCSFIANMIKITGSDYRYGIFQVNKINYFPKNGNKFLCIILNRFLDITSMNNALNNFNERSKIGFSSSPNRGKTFKNTH